MMKLKLIASLLITASITLVGCKKTGDFTIDKEVYVQGEVITTTNTTEKPSEFYKWDFGGTEIVGENASYETGENTPVGSFTIRLLPVNSLNTTDNWKRTSKTVTIEAAEKAKAIFFLPVAVTGGSNEDCIITLTLADGSELSKTITVNNTFPSCANNNNLFAAQFENLAAGDYNFTAGGLSSPGSYFLNGTAELEDGFDCRITNVSTL